MKTWLRLAVLVALLATSGIAAAPAQAEPEARCQEGVQPSGALWLICIPRFLWNGDLVVFAHGYTAYNEPLGFQNLYLPDGTYLPDLVTGLGFAFATTSYRTNGLAVLQGVDDIRELIALFPGVAGRAPDRIYLTGASEGGVITTLLVEQSPDLVSGGLSLCGPSGDFKRQIDYWGDFRVLFDYFFPGVLPPSPISIPQEVIDHWEDIYAPAIQAAVNADPQAAAELLATSHAASDPADPATVVSTILNLLWYNVFATNDGVQKLGGNPYGNRLRWYHGSSNDLRLNRMVQRFSADPAALAELEHYQTSGNLTVPLVMLHTTGDEIVRFQQMVLYFRKVAAAGHLDKLDAIPIRRYGHCNFTTAEVLAGFSLLVLRVTGSRLEGIPQQFDPAQARYEFGQAAGLVPSRP